jgi:SAM-dependent methyltransferase
MKSQPCPKCRTLAPLAYQACDYNKRMSDETFDYYRCPRDGYIFLQPIPADLGKYYPPSYYDLPRDIEEQAQRAEQSQQWKLDIVLSAAKSGRLLEIGPAYGLFAYLAKRSGFDVTGVEMDARCCQHLRDIVGIDVVETDDTLGALEQLAPFDVIVMWQVIEHLPDPWAVIEAAAKRLKPGGVLIIDTPNPDAFQFRVLGHRWAHLDAPRHVVLIPARMLAAHAEQHGLRTEVLTASNVCANGFNGFGWAFTFQNFIGDNFIGRTANFFGRALAKLLIPIERTGWRGSTYTAIFRRAG